MTDIKLSQADRVRDYIAEFGSITQLEALRDLGVMRLASRITDLRKEGVAIKRESIPVKTRFGTVSYVARYSFAK
jgi:hypothetical protein